MANDSDTQLTPLFDRQFVLAIAPQRCGLQWLDQYLREHDEVCLPHDAKEIFYFDRLFGRGSDFYAQHFAPESSHKLVMELTSTAFDHIDASSRVHDLFGKDLKIICLLRHPVRRSYALYIKLKQYGILEGSLEEISAEAPHILNGSRYAGHIENWLKKFDLEQIHFVYYEDLVFDPHGFAKEVCSILEITYLPPSFDMMDGDHLSMWQRVMRGFGKKYKVLSKQNEFMRCEDIPDEDLAWLRARLGREASKFETLIGHEVRQWKA